MPRLAAVLLALASLSAAPAWAVVSNTPDPNAWVPDRYVASVIRAGGTTWVGGGFDFWGPWTGRAAGADVTDGALDTGFPIVSGGYVEAMTPDGNGGAYIGGSFTKVDGQPRTGLAHLNAGGSLDPSFTPAPDGYVESLALAPNSANLYIGGKFTHVDGQAHNGLAAVAPLGDTVRAWSACVGLFSPQIGEVPEVDALTVSSDSSTVYAGGHYDEAGTSANCSSGGQYYLAAFNASTGAPTTWNPKVGGDVNALALSGSTLYVGGAINLVGANQVNRPGLAAISTTTGNAGSFAPSPNSSIAALAVSGTTIYAGGDFSTIGTNAAHRSGLAALSNTGAATAFDAHLAPDPTRGYTYVQTIALTTSPSRVIAGGMFSTASGKPDLVSADPSTGAVDEAFDPRPGGGVHAVSETSPGHVFFGGEFDSVGAVLRPGLVQLDALGHPTAFAASAAGGGVNFMTLSPNHSTIYAAGFFDGSSTPVLRAFSTATGAELPWTPSIGGIGTVNAIAVSPDGQTVYLGGSFTSVDGAPRARLAAVSASGPGDVLAWRPDADAAVNAIAPTSDGSLVYVGGQFSQIGPSVATRHNLAALSSATGDATSWAPEPDGAVAALTLAPDGAHVYVGGQFTHIGTTHSARVGIADVTTATANATPFAAEVDDYGPSNIAVPDDQSAVYAAGFFRKAFNSDRWGIDAFDGATGSELGWFPALSPFNHGTFVAVADATVYLGGGFDAAGAALRPYYTQYSTAPVAGSPPVLSATPQAGAAVGCTPAAWRNGPDVTVQWLLDGAAIAGAAGPAYTPAAGDVGHALACRETGVNAAGSASSTSAPATVAPSPPPAGGGATGGGDGGGSASTGTGDPPPASTPTAGRLTLGVALRGRRPRARRPIAITIVLSGAARVSCTLSATRRHHKPRAIGASRWDAKAGRTKASLAAGRHAKAGRYRIACRAVAASGARTKTVSLAVRLR